MSKHIPTALAREVRSRAKECCEYCWLPQSSQEATFHIDHVLPRVEGGATIADNLALACVSCSLRKGGIAEWGQTWKILAVALPLHNHSNGLFLESFASNNKRMDGTCVGLNERR